MNRLLLTLLVFSCLSLLWLAWFLFHSVRKLADGTATGIGFSLPSGPNIAIDLAVLALMALLSYWIAGRFVKKG